MKKIIECYAADVPLGSYIEKDLLSSKNVLLIPKGTKVTDKVYRALQRYMGKILVEIEADDDTKIEYTAEKLEEDDKIFKLSDSIKKRTLENAELMYSGDNKDTIIKSALQITDAIMQGLEYSKSALISLDALKVTDEYTFKHCVDVGAMAMLIARKLGESDKFIKDIALAGVLHDIGKNKIPLEILNKPSKLEGKEWEIMKKHPIISYQIVKDMDEISDEIKEAVVEHHENIDGTGYPFGLKGEKINRMARIITVADVYDALVTERPYKEAKNPANALEMILAMANKFDVEILKAFLDCVILYPIGSTIKLNNGALCTVIKNNENYPLRPTCQNIVTGQVYDLYRDARCLSLVIS